MYTTQEAARQMGITDAYVRQLIGAGKLTAKRLGDRVWVIAEDEIERFKSLERKPGGRPRISDESSD